MNTMDFASLDLPRTWDVKPIRDVYAFTRKPRYLNIPKDSSLPFLPMDTIPIGRVHVSTFEERDESKLTSGTYVENGDLLVAKITPSFENGKQAIVDWDRPFGYATTEVIPLQDIEGISDKHFLFHLLLHPEVRSSLAGKMDGTTGRQRLSKEVLGDYVIPVPPLPEQRKIASVLGLVQRAIEQQERLIALTTELKKSLRHKLFTEGLRGERQKQTEIGLVPESWQMCSIGDVAQVKGGKRLPKGDKFAEGSTSFPYIRVTDFSEFGVNTSGLRYLRPETQTSIKRYTISTRDVYISIAGSIGLTGMIPPELEGANLTENAARIVITTPDMDARFLMYFLGAETAQKEISSKTVKNAQPKLALARIASLKIPVPSIEEQSEIAKALDTIGEKQIVTRQKKQLLNDLSRTLLHQLMTAQIRVHDLDLSFLEQEAVAS